MWTNNILDISILGGFVWVFSASLIGTALGALLMILRIRSFNWVPKKVENSSRSAFSPFHIWDCIYTTFKARPGLNRRYFLILMTLFSVPIFPYCGDYFIDYFYVRTVFTWTFTDYSNYATIAQGVALVGTFIKSVLRNILVTISYYI